MTDHPPRLKTYDRNGPVIFMHIPKCAGTSSIRLLRRWFQDGYHHPHQDETQDILLPRVDVKLDDGNWDPQVQCIHSHFDHGRGYGLPYHYPEVNQYFAFMRDPFDLIVSMYFFAKGRSRRGDFLYRGRPIDLRERYPTVRHYLETPQPWVENHLPVDMTPENCAAYVAEKFVYLGYFEDLQVSVDQLAFVLGKRKQRLPRQNAASYDEEIPFDLRPQIYASYPKAKALHDLSRELYRLDNFDSRAILPALAESNSSKTHRTAFVRRPSWLTRFLFRK